MKFFKFERRLIVLLIIVGGLGLVTVLVGLQYRSHIKNDIVKLSETLEGESQKLNLVHEIYLSAGT